MQSMQETVCWFDDLGIQKERTEGLLKAEGAVILNSQYRAPWRGVGVSVSVSFV